MINPEIEQAFQQLDLREKPILLVNCRSARPETIIKMVKALPPGSCYPGGQIWFLDNCDLEQVDDKQLLDMRCIRSGAVIDKTKWRIRFEDETETTVRVIIERNTP